MATPTDFAKVHFNTMKGYSDRIAAAKTDEDYRMLIGASVQVLGYGLEEMATGLRATYLLLEQIDRRLQKLEQMRKI